MALAGVALGPLFRANERCAFRVVLLAGVSMLVLFVVLRLFGGPAAGNLRGLPRGEGSAVPLIAFLSVCKYPPSLSYALLTLGVDSVVMCSLHRAHSAAASGGRCAIALFEPLLVFGRVPLFFYILHFWLLAAVGFFVKLLGDGLPLALVPVPWAAVVVLAFPLCRHYAKFKASTSPDSLWRFL